MNAIPNSDNDITVLVRGFRCLVEYPRVCCDVLLVMNTLIAALQCDLWHTHMDAPVSHVRVHSR